MGRKKTPGLVKRGDMWHIDKSIRGHGRLCESTGTDSLAAAEEYLRQRIEEIRARRFQTRPVRLWQDAAAKYLIDNQARASIVDDSYHLEDLNPYIGQLSLQQVHDDTLASFVKARREKGRKTKSINLALGLVRKILNLASRSWRHPDSGLTWLEVPPMITMQQPPKGMSDAAKAYPLDWDEQDRLIMTQPAHLARMTLYKVNTGCRQAEVCGLRWKWEWHTDNDELKGRVFIIPGDEELTPGKGVKNRQDRLVVLNDIAKSVVDSQRSVHPTHVFSYNDKPVSRMNNSSWSKAWIRAGLPTDEKHLKGVHNLRHTFGRRLRAAGVALETRKVLLGHSNGDITSHYSAPEIQELLSAVSKLCERKSRKNHALNIVRLKVVNG